MHCAYIPIDPESNTAETWGWDLCFTMCLIYVFSMLDWENLRSEF